MSSVPGDVPTRGTTIRIDYILHDELRARAREEGIVLNTLIVECIRSGLRQRRTVPGPQREKINRATS